MGEKLRFQVFDYGAETVVCIEREGKVDLEMISECSKGQMTLKC